MKITYIGMGDLNYVTRKRSYRFNASNNKTVDVENYEDIYQMFRDSRHGTSLKFADDPQVKKAIVFKKPGISTLAAVNPINKGDDLVITTTTAAGKKKVQQVKDLDSEIDNLIKEVNEVESLEVLEEVKKKTTPKKPKKKKSK